MSTDTSYASLLGGMWAPEGSEMSERLKRLQELEQKRKDREARRQELLKMKGPIAVVRTAHFQSSAPEAGSVSELPRIQRATSLQEISRTQDHGARPKMLGLSLYGYESSASSKSIFSDVTSSLLAPGRTHRNHKENLIYDDTNSFSGSTDPKDINEADMEYRSLNNDAKLYNMSFSEKEPKKSIFSSVTKSILKPRKGFEKRQYEADHKRNKFQLIDGDSKPYIFGVNNSNTKSDNLNDRCREPFTFGLNVNSDSFNFNKMQHSKDNREDACFENSYDHDEMLDDDSEDPKDFIERLNNGMRYTAYSGYNRFSNANTNYHLQSMPTLPPLKKWKSADNCLNDIYSDVPEELEQPLDDITGAADTIHMSFDVPSPKTPNTVNKMQFTSEFQKQNNIDSSDENVQMMKVNKLEDTELKGIGVNGDSSLTYDFHEVSYGCLDDKGGQLLPVRDSLYEADSSEFAVLNQTLTGKDEVNYGPNISKDLDGNDIRAELEMNYFESKLEDDSFTGPLKTETHSHESKQWPSSMMAKETAKFSFRNPIKNNSTLVNKVETTGNENDAVKSSESNNDLKEGLKKPRTSQLNDVIKTRSSIIQALPEQLSDKLDVLQLLITEKRKKQANGDIEALTADTSCSESSDANQLKHVRIKDHSPKPVGTELKKNIRELKQYVHEYCSESNTFENSSTKSLSELNDTNMSQNLTKEIGIQTDLVDIPTVKNVYTCKHCGRSSDEQLNIVFSKEIASSSVVNYDKILKFKSELQPEIKVGSKDSAKSFDDLEVKSDISEVKGRAAASTASDSCVLNSPNGRLQNTCTGQPITVTNKKASCSELVIDNNDKTHGKDLSTETFNRETDDAGCTDKSVPLEKAQLESKPDKDKSTPIMSLFRGNAVERDTAKDNGTLQNVKSKLIKSRNVEHVDFLYKDSCKNEQSSIKQSVKKENIIMNKPNTVGKRSLPAALSPKPVSVGHTGDKLNFSTLEKKASEERVTLHLYSPIKETSEDKLSPRNDQEIQNVVFESQFTTLQNNPFIKNDRKQTNNFTAQEKVESVLERAESHSSNISPKWSNATAELESPSRYSSLPRSSACIGEKSNCSQLSQSDSKSHELLKNGSLLSFHKSMSNSHGSDSILHKNENAALETPKTELAASTSVNAMLKSLSPVRISQNPIETDMLVDTFYNNRTSPHKMNKRPEENIEQTVDMAHSQVANQACDSLQELELKNRDCSSNASNNDKDCKNRSSNISLKWSNSTAGLESPPRFSSLPRSSTCIAEKSDCSQLSRSDSESRELLEHSVLSLHGSTSNSHGSDSILHKNENAALETPKTESAEPISPDAMLKSLSPFGTSQNPIETLDMLVDESYNSHINEHKMNESTEEHIKQTVDMAHSKFVNQACDSLQELELKNGDFSNACNNDKDCTNSIKTLSHVKGNEPQVICKETTSQSNVTANGKKEKSSKRKKSFFKGKFFRR